MRHFTTALVLVVVIVVTLAIAWLTADYAQYSNPITTVNGVAMVTTDRGDQVYADVEYISGKLVSVKPIAIAAVIPATLPYAGVAHGDYTCVVSGVEVTQTSPCELSAAAEALESFVKVLLLSGYRILSIV